MEFSSEPVTWADLPDETVEHIYETLSPGDCIRLGRVSFGPSVSTIFGRLIRRL